MERNEVKEGLTKEKRVVKVKPTNPHNRGERTEEMDKALEAYAKSLSTADPYNGRTRCDFCRYPACHIGKVNLCHFHSNGTLPIGEKKTMFTLKWDKVPSVIGGGKPYFYVAFPLIRDRQRKLTVVYDRTATQWALQYDSFEDLVKTVAFYPTAKIAMQAAEHRLEDNSF